MKMFWTIIITIKKKQYTDTISDSKLEHIEYESKNWFQFK